MKAVIQRVKNASVTIENKLYSEINTGMLILFCVEKNDTEDKLEWIANKIEKLRIFEDEQQKMNLSVKDINGEILVVSQFTLAASCQKGTRPSFDNAEQPDKANKMYQQFIAILKQKNLAVKTGIFAANMQVSLINDGPVTFILEKYTKKICKKTCHILYLRIKYKKILEFILLRCRGAKK